ncbi:MAG TPA: sugar phosphate isomerase/epimerase family protein [Sphingobacteriaceae bacterium]
MTHTSRRAFLQNASLLLAGAFATYSFGFKSRKPLLAFSTLGCPDWTFPRITDFASKHGYQGLEVRGILRETDLTRSPIFSTSESRKTTVKRMQDKELHFVGLGSSAMLHHAAPAERKKNLDEGKRFIDLAQEIDCPYVRVFPNNFPKDQEKEATIGLITQGMMELAGHANGSSVTVLMETHGDLVRADDLLTIMDAAPHKHAGLVWDIANMWTITRQSPSDVYNKLKKYIRHTHIKDARIVAGKPEYTLLGQGEVPVFEAIRALVKGNYAGYYSFEWEKLWHPEIAEPETALAHFPGAIHQYLKQL